VSNLYSLSRKEGWRRWVDTPARQRPDLLTRRQLSKLGIAVGCERVRRPPTVGKTRTPIDLAMSTIHYGQLPLGM
jgi:hypothetical protein